MADVHHMHMLWQSVQVHKLFALPLRFMESCIGIVYIIRGLRELSATAATVFRIEIASKTSKKKTNNRPAEGVVLQKSQLRPESKDEKPYSHQYLPSDSGLRAVIDDGLKGYL